VELGADPVLFAESVSDAVVIKLAETLAVGNDAKKALEAKLAAADGADKGDLSEAVKTLNAAKDAAVQAGKEAKEALASLAAANKATRVARVETVFSAAIKAGRMAPAEAAAMKPAALALVDQDGVVVELASGTGTRKVSALEALLISIDARPKHVMFAEGAEDPEKAASDSIRKAFPSKQEWVDGQLMAAGIKVEATKK
jgi:hypothetical protein